MNNKCDLVEREMQKEKKKNKKQARLPKQNHTPLLHVIKGK